MEVVQKRRNWYVELRRNVRREWHARTSNNCTFATACSPVLESVQKSELHFDDPWSLMILPRNVFSYESQKQRLSPTWAFHNVGSSLIDSQEWGWLKSYIAR